MLSQYSLETELRSEFCPIKTDLQDLAKNSQYGPINYVTREKYGVRIQFQWLEGRITIWYARTFRWSSCTRRTENTHQTIRFTIHRSGDKNQKSHVFKLRFEQRAFLILLTQTNLLRRFLRTNSRLIPNLQHAHQV